ncbi:hypothetical protein [Baaleninema simplex]|uniref:hypothetical protein n=1 Tax=Baaleninema simplex TaxID=2862350 RepID=UPI000346F7BA|nr:hypothetical protein [Baaleninema simplex]
MGGERQLARHHQPNVIVSAIDLPQLDRYEYERDDLWRTTTRLDSYIVRVASRTDDESRQFATKLREYVKTVTASRLETDEIATETVFASVAIETELKQPA